MRILEWTILDIFIKWNDVHIAFICVFNYLISFNVSYSNFELFDAISLSIINEIDYSGTGKITVWAMSLIDFLLKSSSNDPPSKWLSFFHSTLRFFSRGLWNSGFLPFKTRQNALKFQCILPCLEEHKTWISKSSRKNLKVIWTNESHFEGDVFDELSGKKN